MKIPFKTCRGCQARALESVSGLDVYFCSKCSLVQLGGSVPTEKRPSSSRDAERLREVSELLRRLAPTPKAKVLEIGSSDGTLLTLIQEWAGKALSTEMPAPDIRERYGQYDLAVALDIVPRTPDFVSLLQRTQDLLAPGGRFVMEAPYIVDKVLSGQLAGIPSGHIHFFSLHTLRRAFRKANLKLVDAEILPTQSLRVIASRRDGAPPIGHRARQILKAEKANHYTARSAFRGKAKKAS